MSNFKIRVDWRLVCKNYFHNHLHLWCCCTKYTFIVITDFSSQYDNINIAVTNQPDFSISYVPLEIVWTVGSTNKHKIPSSCYYLRSVASLLVVSRIFRANGSIYSPFRRRITPVLKIIPMFLNTIIIWIQAVIW